MPKEPRGVGEGVGVGYIGNWVMVTCVLTLICLVRNQRVYIFSTSHSESKNEVQFLSEL